MRVLLVEDDPSLGETLQAWLQLDGYAVDWLRRGDQAHTALQTHDYQCVLLDRGLPGMTGDAVLSALRSRQAAVPVIVLTARDALTDRVQALHTYEVPEVLVLPVQGGSAPYLQWLYDQTQEPEHV